MADISITAANVLASGSATKDVGVAGAVLTAGQVVYKEAASSQWKLSDADHASAEGRVAGGITLNGAAVGQPVVVALPGSDITIGGTLVGGTPYYLSDSPGGIRSTPDTGDRVMLIGVGISATVLRFRPIDSGVTL